MSLLPLEFSKIEILKERYAPLIVPGKKTVEEIEAYLAERMTIEPTPAMPVASAFNGSLTAGADQVSRIGAGGY